MGNDEFQISDDSSLGWDWGRWTRILWRKAWLVGTCVLIGIALGVVYLLVAPKVYEATTVVEVVPEGGVLPAASGASADEVKAPEFLKTIEQNLGGGALLLRLYKVNKLDQDPRYLAEKGGLLGNLIKWIMSIWSHQGGPPTDASLIRDMNDRLTVKLRRGTRLVDVAVQAEDPALAQQLSQSLVNEYMQLNFQQKLEASKLTTEYLIGEARRLMDKLEKSEQKLQAYKEEKKAVSLEDKQNIVVDTLKDLNLKLSAARSDRVRLESDLAQVERCGDRTDELLGVAGIASSQDVLLLKPKISDQQGVLTSMMERYPRGSPKFVQAETQLKDLNAALEAAVRHAAAQVRNSHESALATEKKLLESLGEQEQEALELNRISIQFNVLSRDVDSDRALYEAVLRQLKETEVIQGVAGSIRVVDPAAAPDRPASPRKSIVLALALFLGLATGSAAALGPALLKAPLLGTSDVENRLNLPALGAIPSTRIKRKPGFMLLRDNPDTSAAEAVRSLRVVLSPSGKEPQTRSLLFTSALAGEGKTFCSVNFAAALAIDGLRTLLIDADLRSPAIGGRLFGQEPSQGLTDILSSGVPLEKVVRPASIENLFVLTAGAPTKQPSELLGSPRMGDLLKMAIESYDRVVLDSSSVLETSDSLRVAGRVHSVCFIVRAGRTPGAVVQRALRLFNRTGGKPPTGVLLNRVPRGFD